MDNFSKELRLNEAASVILKSRAVWVARICSRCDGLAGPCMSRYTLKGVVAATNNKTNQSTYTELQQITDKPVMPLFTVQRHMNGPGSRSHLEQILATQTAWNLRRDASSYEIEVD